MLSRIIAIIGFIYVFLILQWLLPSYVQIVVSFQGQSLLYNVPCIQRKSRINHIQCKHRLPSICIPLYFHTKAPASTEIWLSYQHIHRIQERTIYMANRFWNNSHPGLEIYTDAQEINFLQAYSVCLTGGPWYIQGNGLATLSCMLVHIMQIQYKRTVFGKFGIVEGDK